MTTNPLKDREHGGGKIGMEKLQAYCDWLNGQPWVRGTGGPYFIGRKEKADGAIEYRLDRKVA